MQTILVVLAVLAVALGAVAFVPSIRFRVANLGSKVSALMLDGHSIGAEFTGGDDEVGDDDILGALARGQAPRGAGRMAGKPRPKSDVSAVALRVPMGVGTHTWAATEDDEIEFEVEPQRDFTPDRMIVDFVTDDTVLLNVTSIKVGDQPQNPNDDIPLPAAMFAKETTDAHVQFDTIKASRKLRVAVQPTAALAAMTSATCQVGMYGWMVRGGQ